MVSLASALGFAMLASQAAGATLQGEVKDALTGDPVTGAVLVLTDVDRSTTSGPDGRYTFHDVSAGPHHLRVGRLGYEARTLHALVPASGHVEIHVSIQPEPVALQGLDVFPRVAVRGADSQSEVTPHPAVAVSAAAVRNHPLLPEPDFFAAVAGGAVFVEPETPRGLHVRGGSSDQVTFLLDGIPVFSPYHSTGLFSAWNPDALSHMRLYPTPLVSDAPDALSGVVSAETRRPGKEVRARGAISTVQARLTVDGPFPGLGVGYLVSARTGFPGVFDPEEEASYVLGRSSDGLAKLEGRLGGGRFRLLGYLNRNWTSAASHRDSESDPDEMEDNPADGGRSNPRNRFAWGGRSWGGEWMTNMERGARLRVRAWSASATASSRWTTDEPTSVRLNTSRDDAGGAVTVESGDSAAQTVVGVRANWSRTLYHVRQESTDNPASYQLEGDTRVAAAFLQHTRSLGGQTRVELGLLAALYDDDPKLAPRLRVHWKPWSPLALSAGMSFAHQAEQSLRNPESVAGYLFPPALYVGAGAPGIPVAHSEQFFITGELEPLPGVRIGAQAYERDFGGLLLVAPSTSQPFATDDFAPGTGSSRGAALDVAISTARYALIGSYGYQRVRLAHGDTAYVPDYAAAHNIDAGAIVYPDPTISFRLGLSSLLGRRTTAVSGLFEWEACNLLDRGCEFVGSPQQRSEPLGSTRLPAYVRLDAGARKHWHLRIGGNEATVGIYASVTNLLGRKNLLTVSEDPITGEREWIEMRSLGPLVIGIDWQF